MAEIERNGAAAADVADDQNVLRWVPGRPDVVPFEFMKHDSAAWHHVMGTPEDAIEVAVIEAPIAV
jgi:hypothetical protein